MYLGDHFFDLGVFWNNNARAASQLKERANSKPRDALKISFLTGWAMESAGSVFNSVLGCLSPCGSGQGPDAFRRKKPVMSCPQCLWEVQGWGDFLLNNVGSACVERKQHKIVLRFFLVEFISYPWLCFQESLLAMFRRFYGAVNLTQIGSMNKLQVLYNP